MDNSPLLRQEGQGAYNSPILSDGEHTVIVALADESIFPAFDYLTVNAGPSTFLNGRTLIVDDSDTDILYQGNWSTMPLVPVAFGYSTAPYQNTTHWSSTPGDSLSVSFTGQLAVAIIKTERCSDSTSRFFYLRVRCCSRLVRERQCHRHIYHRWRRAHAPLTPRSDAPGRANGPAFPC